MENTTPVAKSLHTVKVIQQVAGYVLSITPRPMDEIDNPTTAQKGAAIAAALEILGLAGRPDPYGLAEKALRLWK